MKNYSFDSQEYIELLTALDMRHGSFYYLWDMGRPRLLDDEQVLQYGGLPTAGVLFDKHGNYLEFLINAGFWEQCTFQQKVFVIAHECLHVTYNHGYRLFRHAKNQHDVLLMNFACDVVINHKLLSLGMKRSEVDPDNKYCWMDTVFKDRPDVLPNQGSEYYYEKLREMSANNIQKILESGISTVDQHNMSDGDQESGKGSGDQFVDMTPIIDALADRLSDEEMNEVAKDYKNFHEKLDSKINENAKDGKEAGKSPGSVLKIVDVTKKVPKKSKWETVIKKWVLKSLSDEMKEEEQWTKKNRRFEALTSEFMLPSEVETDEPIKQKHKIEVYFFLDTSGSCAGYAERFFKAARSIPEDRFNVRLFCFDTRVYSTTLKSGKLYGFGGTSFAPLESEIQKIIKSENVKYPDAVFVITDGYGDRVRPEKPKNWHWFLTEYHTTSYIPTESNRYKLNDFE